MADNMLTLRTPFTNGIDIRNFGCYGRRHARTPTVIKTPLHTETISYQTRPLLCNGLAMHLQLPRRGKRTNRHEEIQAVTRSKEDRATDDKLDRTGLLYKLCLPPRSGVTSGGTLYHPRSTLHLHGPQVWSLVLSRWETRSQLTVNLKLCLIRMIRECFQFQVDSSLSAAGSLLNLGS